MKQSTANKSWFKRMDPRMRVEAHIEQRQIRWYLVLYDYEFPLEKRIGHWLTALNTQASVGGVEVQAKGDVVLIQAADKHSYIQPVVLDSVDRKQLIMLLQSIQNTAM